MKKWIYAARLRTLPLALATIGLGGLLASETDTFSPVAFTLAMLTALFLQVLSNFANDLGDYKKGVDKHREGEKRMVQSGEITPSAMKRAVYMLVFLSLASGILLLYFSPVSTYVKAVFFGFGIAAILAAILYTNGKRPYGYIGLGDLFVLIFFGLVGVGGTCYISSGHMETALLLPSLAMGMLATAVLNFNNLRDMASDRKSGKISIPVRIGQKNALLYQLVLMITPFLLLISFAIIEDWQFWRYGFLLVLPLFVRNAVRMFFVRQNKFYDQFLKPTALGSAVLVILISIGFLLS